MGGPLACWAAGLAGPRRHYPGGGGLGLASPRRRVWSAQRRRRGLPVAGVVFGHRRTAICGRQKQLDSERPINPVRRQTVDLKIADSVKPGKLKP